MRNVTVMALALISATWAVSVKNVEISSVADGFPLKTCWNAIGVDNQDRVYVVYSPNRELKPEDCIVIRYNPETGDLKNLGRLIQVLKDADNYENGEGVSKGHSDVPYLDGKMYIGTQGFHDVGKSEDGTTSWSGVCNYRGSHLIEVDVATGDMRDLSANKPGGVFQDCQGIIGLSAIPAMGLIVAGSHPRCDLVYYNPATDEIEREIRGQGDDLLAPPRSLVACPNGDVYYSRGWDGRNNTCVYDYSEDKTHTLSNGTTGGFWNGRAQSCDGWKAWVTTVDGNIYEIDTQDKKIHHKGSWPGNEQMLCMSLSLDEKKLYAMPSKGSNARKLIEYDVQSDDFTVFDTKKGTGRHITGNNARDSKGRIYFAGSNYSDEGWIVEVDVRDRSGPAPASCQAQTKTLFDMPATASPAHRKAVSIMRAGGMLKIINHGQPLSRIALYSLSGKVLRTIALNGAAKAAVTLDESWSKSAVIIKATDIAGKQSWSEIALAGT